MLSGESYDATEAREEPGKYVRCLWTRWSRGINLLQICGSRNQTTSALPRWRVVVATSWGVDFSYECEEGTGHVLGARDFVGHQTYPPPLCIHLTHEAVFRCDAADHVQL